MLLFRVEARFSRVTVNESSRVLILSRALLYNLMLSGQVASIKVGRVRHIPVKPSLRVSLSLRKELRHMSKRGQNEGAIYKRNDGLWVAVVNLGYVGVSGSGSISMARLEKKLRTNYQMRNMTRSKGYP